jgi:hypothetical protein
VMSEAPQPQPEEWETEPQVVGAISEAQSLNW